jgi:hypothetical protein
VTYEAIRTCRDDACALIRRRHEGPCRAELGPGSENKGRPRYCEKASAQRQHQRRGTLGAAGKGGQESEDEAEGREVCDDRRSVTATPISAPAAFAVTPADSQQDGPCEGEHRGRAKDCDED